MKTEQDKKKEKFSQCVYQPYPHCGSSCTGPPLSHCGERWERTLGTRLCVYVPQANFMAYLCSDSQEIYHKV